MWTCRLTGVVEQIVDLGSQSRHDVSIKQRIQTGEQECADYDGNEDFHAGIDIALRLLGSDCGLNGNSSVLAISSTNVENLEATCYLLELLGYYGKHTPFKSINDAYYETTLKLQATDTDEDARMLDIIFDNILYDAGEAYDFGQMGTVLATLVQNRSADITSAFDAVRDQINAEIQDIIDLYKN